MDSLGAEVSAKIRSAIKAKLIELGAYVDDELPDYIMVMVANKKTKEQMEDDLNLFLSGNTTVFVNWLHQVLDKLQKVTLGDGGKKKKSKKKAVTGTGTKKKIKEKKEDKTKKPKVKSEKKKKSPVKKGKASILKKPEEPLDEPYDPVEEIHRVRRSSLDHQPVRKSWSKSRSRSPMMKKPIVSHDSDGEYDPEQMLKKSLASQVKITPRPDRPNQASKSLVLKAVADADRSIRKKKREDRKRDEELDEIHKKRLQLTKARKEGRLDWEVIEEINKKRRSEEPRRKSEEPRRRSEEEPRRRRYDDPRDVDVRDDPRDVDVRERTRERTISERSSRKRQHRSERRVDPPLEKKVGALRSDQIYETKEVKKIRIEIEEEEEEEEESLGQHDLRHRLGKRRRSDGNGRRNNSGTERDNSRSRMEEKMRRSGITIRVDTTKFESPELAEQEPVDQEPVVPVVEEELATPEKPKVDEDDDLEIMRRRALESMARRKARFAHEQRAASRTSSTEDTEVKKILIPLNEDSSTDEEDDKEESIKNVETGTAPKNSSDSSSDSSDSSSSELSLSDEEEQTTKDGEPQFIVTLEGINSDYFRSRHRSEKGKDEQGHVKPPEKTQPKVSKPDSKGDSVTPVQVTNKKPTPAKKVVPTPVKEPTSKPVPPPASKPVVLPNSRKKITPPARPEAKVAPLRKPIQAPPPTENKSEVPKKERKRITAPEPDPKPIVTPVLSRPLKPSVLVTPRPVTTSSERCKFWPKCSRGDQCFYFHPKPKLPYTSMPNPDKYRWTSASALP